MSTSAVARLGTAAQLWTTQRVLRTLRSGLIVLELALLVFVLYAMGKEQQAFGRLNQQAMPGVVSVAEMRTSMAEMDAAAARELAPGMTREPGRSGAYEHRHSKVLCHLLEAASDTSGDDAERTTLQRVEEDLNRYDVMVERARDPGRDRAALSAAETLLLEQTLQPATDQLMQARGRRASEIADRERVHANADRFLLVCLVVGLMILLVSTQVTLSQRTHRTLNLGLLLATLLTVGEGAYAWNSVTELHRQFQGDLMQELQATKAGENAQTAAALYRAEIARRALGGPAAARQTSAKTQAADVVVLPLGLSLEETTAALREGRVLEGFRGDLAQAWATAPTEAQREALLQALAAWQAVTEASAKVPANDARRLPTGAQPGDLSEPSNLRQADALFEDAMERANALGLQQYQETTRQAVREVSRVEIIATAASVVCVVLVLAGFAPRLREYDQGT